MKVDLSFELYWCRQLFLPRPSKIIQFLSEKEQDRFYSTFQSEILCRKHKFSEVGLLFFMPLCFLNSISLSMAL